MASPHRVARWLAAGALAVMLLMPRTASADGLRIGVSFAALNYPTTGGTTVDLYYSAFSARVSRGRAALTFTVPYVGISGGTIVLSDESYAVAGGEPGTRWGLGDMSTQLDYNIYQNRPKMIIVTLSGFIRFPTASTALGIGTGEHTVGLGLSGVYGITRKLIAFADVRQDWVAILTPTAAWATSAEAGLIYWLTDRFGLTGSLQFVNYAGRAPNALDLNLGATYELFPGFMINAMGIAGLTGESPRGGTFGFGFEL